VASSILDFLESLPLSFDTKVPEVSRDFMNTGVRIGSSSQQPERLRLAWQNRLVVGRAQDVSALPAFSSGPDQTNTFEKK